jgi:hypothetical protein
VKRKSADPPARLVSRLGLIVNALDERLENSSQYTRPFVDELKAIDQKIKRIIRRGK